VASGTELPLAVHPIICAQAPGCGQSLQGRGNTEG